MTQALRGQDGGAFERQTAQDRGDHFLKLFVTFPTWQDELIEPTRQLDVAGNQVNSILEQSPSSLRQKARPERHAVGWQVEINFALQITPAGDWRPQQC